MTPRLPSAAESAWSRSPGGVGDGMEGAGNTLVNGQVGDPLGHRGLVQPDGASIATQFGAEPPDLRR